MITHTPNLEHPAPYISLTPACLLFFAVAAMLELIPCVTGFNVLAASLFFSSSIFLSLFSVFALPEPFPWN